MSRLTYKFPLEKATFKVLQSFLFSFIDRAGGLYGRILDLGREYRPMPRFSRTDRLTSVNKMFIICGKQERFNSVNVTDLY